LQLVSQLAIGRAGWNLSRAYTRPLLKEVLFVLRCSGMQRGERSMVTQLTRELNEECNAVVHDMGNTMRLLIPKDGSMPKLVADRRFHPENVRKERSINLVVVRELIRRGVISALTEHGIDQRTGWRVAGLPGETNEVYVLTQ
jgi:hypothetical protein